MTDVIFDFVINLTKSVRLTVLIVAVLPVFEARLAIPIAIKYGLKPLEAFLYGFLGSSLAVVPLLLFLLPLIKLLAKTKMLKKIAGTLLFRAENKARIIKGGDAKRMLGVAGFAALPLPLTGVWTSSLLSGILGLKYFKSLLSIIIGNLIAAVIITVASVFFAEYINIIAGAVLAAALISVAVLLIKAFLPHKKIR